MSEQEPGKSRSGEPSLPPEHDEIANFYAQAAANAVRGYAEDQKHALWVKLGLAATAGAMLGAGTCALLSTGRCEEAAWWNPLAAWRALKGIESNILLQVVSPETTQAAKLASGALVTAGAGALGMSRGRKSIDDGGDQKSNYSHQEEEKGSTRSRQGEESEQNRSVPAEPHIYIYPRRTVSTQRGGDQIQQLQHSRPRYSDIIPGSPACTPSRVYRKPIIYLSPEPKKCQPVLYPDCAALMRSQAWQNQKLSCLTRKISHATPHLACGLPQVPEITDVDPRMLSKCTVRRLEF